jgi:hypothetical protein
VKLGRLLFLSLLAGGVFAVYYFFIPRVQNSKNSLKNLSVSEAEKTLSSPFLLDAREELEGFILNRKDLRFEIAKASDGWTLLSPVQGAVSDLFLRELFQDMHEARLEDSFLIQPEELSRFGLSPPLYEMELITNARPKRVLQIGQTSPRGDTLYVRWKDENKVSLMRSRLKNILGIPLSGVRNPKLFALPPQDLSGFEILWQGERRQAVYYRSHWRLKEPLDKALDEKRVFEYLDHFWNLKIQNYPESWPFPASLEENFIRFYRRGGKPLSLQVGALDKVKAAYPVFLPVENLRAWIAEKDLTPLLTVPLSKLYSRRFIDFAIQKVRRVQVAIGDQEFSLIAKENGWQLESSSEVSQIVQGIDELLLKLTDLEYLKTLNETQKSVLLFDPTEVALVLSLFREGRTNAFMEFKFYLREEAYLEINSSAPLYVLSKNRLEPFLRFFERFQREGAA